jgi:DNA invertase Pin-like site-specific DNA recombinase
MLASRQAARAPRGLRNRVGQLGDRQPPDFIKLMDRLELDDVLIVTKLDHLGRNAMDGVTP